jgi:SNF2 family DNA or RNA helicase
LSSLIKDEYGNLILEYTPTGDVNLDMLVELWLDGPFPVQNGTKWECGKTLDIVEIQSIVSQTQNKFKEEKIELHVDEELLNDIKESATEDDYSSNIEKAKKIKTECQICKKLWDAHEPEEIVACQDQYTPDVSPRFIRHLKSYQKFAVTHLLAIGHGANFSVPGSGKTTMTYAAISKWWDDGIIDKILVIGPTSSFEPWENEYEECFGEKIKSVIVRGKTAENIEEREEDLLLMHFGTAMNKISKIINFMKKHKVMLIIDESHNIKNPEQKKYATTARKIAPFAKKRMILTGTPMPNTAKDLWVQVTFLWPSVQPLKSDFNYMKYVDKHGIGKWKDTLYPLFSRVKKKDMVLGPKPIFIPYIVTLDDIQQEIYNAIREATLEEYKMNYRDKSKMQTLRVATLIRLIQASSNPTLLVEKASEFDVTYEEFGIPKQKVSFEDNLDPTIYEKIATYSKQKELPAKLVEATRIAKDLVAKGEKVIIWSNFIGNIKILENQLLQDYNPLTIYGDISREAGEEEEEEENREEWTRIQRINKFKNDSDFNILIATPASLSEAVSLHINKKFEKVCSHAIYVDRNFNAAQYMQSMDRIHRLGMDIETQVYYHLIMGKNTIDIDINERLEGKIEEMYDALNDDWPVGLDYDGSRVKIEKTEMKEDSKILFDHLRNLKDKEYHED